ncbi:MAG: DUF4397 domain-containing protein [Chloroflexota bacterium]
MNTKKSAQNSFGKYIVPSGALLLLLTLILASTLNHVAPADANVENINLCFDSSNTTQAAFQVGLFVPNPDYESGVLLQINDEIKGNWQYKYFSGNGETEAKGLLTSVGDATALLSSINVPEPITQTLSMPEVGKYTVLAHGSNENQPIQYSIFQEDLSPIPSGKAKIRVVHISDFDSDLENLNLDIRLAGSNQPLIDSLGYGEQGYFEVDPGDIQLQAVDQTGQFVVFDIASIPAAEGELVSLFLYGNDSDSMDVWVTIDCGNTYRINQLINPPQFPGEVGELRFVNLAPLSSNLAETELRFSLNGDGVNRTIRYGEATEYLTLIAQNYSIQLGLPDSGVVSDQISLDLESGQDYTVIASGGGSAGTPPKLVALTDSELKPGVDQISVRVGNFLSDAVDPSQINFQSENGAIEVNGVNSLEVGFPAYDTYAAGEYEFSVISGPRTLVNLQPVDFASNSIDSLFVAGNGIDQPFGVYRISGRDNGEFLPLNSSRLYVAHLAPFGNDVAGTTVSLEIDGDVVSDFSVYGDSTEYLTLAPGSHTVVVKSNDTTVATQDINLLADEAYTMLFIGSESTRSLTPAVLDDDSQPSDQNIHLRFGNAAPFVRNGELSAVDFSDQSGTLQSNVAFGTVGPGYVTTTAGSVDLSITLAGDSEVAIDPLLTNFDNGDIVTLIATGGDSAFDKSVFVIENGQKGYFLETNTELAQLYFANLLTLSSNTADTAVALKVDDTTVLQDIRFGQSSDGYIEIPVGSVQLEIVQSGTITPILSRLVTIEKDQSYQFIAHGSSGAPESTFRSVLEAPASGFVRFNVGNMTPGNAAFYSGVNILQNGSAIGENLANGTLSNSFTDVPVADSMFKVLSNDNLVTLLETQVETIPLGSVATVLLAGDGGLTQPAGLYAIVDDEPIRLLSSEEGGGNEKPRLTISHFAPFATGVASSVIVQVNDQMVDGDFQYGDVLNQLNGQQGNNAVKIIDPLTNEVIKEVNANLEADDQFYFFVIGGVNGLDIKVLGLKQMKAVSAIDATVTVLNLISIQETVTDRQINLILSNGEDYSVNNLRYTFSDTVQVPAGTYDPVVISPDGIREYANPTQVTYSQGDSILLVVTGDGLNSEVAVYQYQLTSSGLNVAKLSNGGVDPSTFTNFIYLPVITK